MADQWWDSLHNKLYGQQPWAYHSFVCADPKTTWTEYLNTTSMAKSVTEQKDVQPRTPHVANFNIAASQLKNPQDSGHKPDVPSKEESSTSWLEKHKDGFVQVKRSSALHRRRSNVQRPRARARSVAEVRQKQRRNTLDRLLNLDNGVVLPSAQDERDTRQGSDVLGPTSQWRNQVYRVHKRVSDFLGRAGAMVYPASGVERKQLDTFEAEIDQAEKQQEQEQEQQQQQQEQQQQQQVSQGEAVPYPNLGGEPAKPRESTPTNNQAQEHQEVNNNNNNDNDNNTAHQIPEDLLVELLGEQQARLLEERMRYLRGEDAIPTNDNSNNDNDNDNDNNNNNNNNDNNNDNNDNDAPAASTLPPPLFSSSSNPPNPRPFHINHVAHLAPSYIAAQQSRQRALLSSSSSPSSSSPSLPLPQKSSRRETNTTRNNTQVDTAQPLWEGAKRSREIWFGVGPGTGRDVGRRTGQGRRV